MNRVFFKIVILLLIIGKNLQANTLSEMIQESQNCVVGKVISVDSITYTFKVDSSLHLKFSYDTIQVFKNGVSRFSKVKEYVVGQQFILFLTKPYIFDHKEGYFVEGSNNDGLFQIINDSVSYEKYTSYGH